MSKQYVFIDDSGDAGFKNSNSDHLIVAAVIVVDENKKELLEDAINYFRRRLGWVDLHEFKFSKTEKSILIDLIDIVKHYDFKAYAVILDKKNINPDKIIKNRISVYNHVLKELLLQVSKSNQVILIDGKATKSHAEKIRTYLRKSLKKNSIDNVSIRFVDSRKNSIIQLADIIAGAIARSYKDKPDAKRYLSLLESKIIRIDEIRL